MKVYKFSDCYLNAIERKILKNCELLDLTPRAFDVLLLLVENAGSVVTKNKLIREVWSDSFIEEGNIPVHISKLRKLLGATKAEPFIETASGVGYRFVARVEIISQEKWNEVILQSRKPTQKAETEITKIDSIAVLPFENVAQTPELDYLAEGLTESIINNLSYLPEIRVIARNTVFRFKNIQPAQALEIGAALDVSTVLTGRVKVIGTNVIIGVELIKISDGSQLWGKLYNQPFSDIFEIQETIARSISEILRSKITDLAYKSVHRQSPQNARAFASYLKGRHFWAKKNVEDTNRAIKYFQESIVFDPNYIPSYVGMVDCYLSLYQLENISRIKTLSLVNTIVNQVTEFSENSPEILTMIGWFKLILEWDWKKAEFCYKKSLDLNPNNTISQLRYGHWLLLNSKFAKAVTQHQAALSLDPLSTAINVSLGRVFYFMEQFDSAITQLQETLEFDPGNHLALMLLGLTLSTLGRHTEALDIFQSIPTPQKNIESLSMIGYTQALAGRKDEARKIIQQIKHHSMEKEFDATNLAYIYIGLDEIELAFECLEQAFQQHSVDLLGVKVDLRLKPLRNQARFKNLICRIGLDVD